MFRDELDALNAIHQEQQRTNELLERLVSVQPQSLPEPQPAPEVKEPDHETTQGKEVSDDAPKRRGGGNRGKGA